MEGERGEGRKGGVKEGREGWREGERDGGRERGKEGGRERGEEGEEGDRKRARLKDSHGRRAGVGGAGWFCVLLVFCVFCWLFEWVGGW